MERLEESSWKFDCSNSVADTDPNNFARSLSVVGSGIRADTGGKTLKLKLAQPECCYIPANAEIQIRIKTLRMCQTATSIFIAVELNSKINKN